MRLTDPEVFRIAIQTYAESITGLDPAGWLANTANVALVNDSGDVACFERQYRLPSCVCGHYFFNSRGRAALTAAQQFLHDIFTGPYSVEVIIGLTPVEHKAALWMNRQLQFQSHGQIEAETGLCEFVLLTKQEWLGDNK